MIKAITSYTNLYNLILILCMSSLLFSSGCTSIKVLPKVKDSQAKKFNVPANKSYVYIVRTASAGVGVLMSVAFDKKNVGVLLDYYYFLLELTPGKHTVTTGLTRSDKNLGFERPTTVEFVTRPGQFYVVTSAFRAWAPSELKILQGEVGKKFVMLSERACTFNDPPSECKVDTE